MIVVASSRVILPSSPRLRKAQTFPGSSPSASHIFSIAYTCLQLEDAVAVESHALRIGDGFESVAIDCE